MYHSIMPNIHYVFVPEMSFWLSEMQRVDFICAKQCKMSTDHLIESVSDGFHRTKRVVTPVMVIFIHLIFMILQVSKN